MSDYVHEKVIRCPISYIKENLNLDIEDPNEIEDFLYKKQPELFKRANKKYFSLEYTDSSVYLDWTYFHTYGEEAGDWGTSRYLTDKEFEVMKGIYDQIGIILLPRENVLRRVEYCYYNGCECEDYYELDNDDDSEELL